MVHMGSGRTSYGLYACLAGSQVSVVSNIQYYILSPTLEPSP